VAHERTLTQRELNRALLARQLLLRRSTLGVARAVERIGALQAQWPPSPYLALWSRLDGFSREQLSRAVARRQVVKATLSLESSAWRRHTAGGKFVRARAWLGREGVGGDAAADHLVRRYLGAFGPASRSDAAQWTGLTMPVLEPVFDRLPLRRFRDEQGHELFDLPRAPLPPARTDAPVRFLPMWDSSLLAHRDRSRILPDDVRRVVIKTNGDVKPAFLVDGFVTGLWRLENDQVETEPFEPLPARTRAGVTREARALERWLAS
jgi:hypothetical protein